MRKQAHIFDTLAEAYYQNRMFPQAYEAAKLALAIAAENHTYYKEQLEKMKKALKGKNMRTI
jgi:hypothetical protein